MKIVARNPGVLDGIMQCTECGGPMIKVGKEYRCLEKVEPEELVAVGLIPSKAPDGKIAFDLAALDQQKVQISQALTHTMDIDDSYIQSLGLNLDKIRQHQLKYGLVP